MLKLLDKLETEYAKKSVNKTKKISVDVIKDTFTQDDFKFILKNRTNDSIQRM